MLAARFDPRWLRCPKQTAHSSNDSSVLRVTVTHPLHPLSSQQVEVIRIRRGSDPDLIIRFPDGLHGAISASWTDFVATLDPLLQSDILPLLDALGLCEISRLVSHLLNRMQSAISLTCSDHDPRYAHHEQQQSPSSSIQPARCTDG